MILIVRKNKKKKKTTKKSNKKRTKKREKEKQKKTLALFVFFKLQTLSMIVKHVTVLSPSGAEAVGLPVWSIGCGESWCCRLCVSGY